MAILEGEKTIPDRLYFRIGDVAEIAEVKPHVLRYWETEFPMIAPEKSATGQRVYRRGDVEAVLMIKHLLYQERYSIEGARKRIRELRKQGELKSFKEAKAAPAAPSAAKASADQFRPGSQVDEQALKERAQKLKAAAKELRSLLKVPMHDIFKY